MHDLNTTFVLGYHGCDAGVAEKLLKGETFRKSENDYDWLGHGIYFWESNPKRGFAFAREAKARKLSRIEKPAVVGAVIDLGLCLDLLAQSGIERVKSAYAEMSKLYSAAGTRLPINASGRDLLLRRLDCAVIETLHALRKRAGEPPIDSVRGVFVEGDPIYENSGFNDKTHIQICVRNPSCIKGVFRVRPELLHEWLA